MYGHLPQPFSNGCHPLTPFLFPPSSAFFLILIPSPILSSSFIPPPPKMPSINDSASRGKQPATTDGETPSPRPSKVQRVVNTAASTINHPPLSYTGLLTAPDNINEEALLASHSLQPGLGVTPQQHIERVIAVHQSEINTLMASQAECFHREVKEVLRVQQEKMDQMASEIAHYKAEAEAWKEKAEELEDEAASLEVELEEAEAAALEAAEEEEEEENDDAESSFDGPNGGERRHKCRLCEEDDAVIMMSPCHHLCICKICDNGVKLCPVCHEKKDRSIEVHFPTDDD